MTNKKKLVHIIDNLRLGGAELLLFSTIKKLPGYEHHVITLTPEVHLNQAENFALIHCVNHKGWFDTLRTCNRIRNLIQQLRPHVIHSHLFLSSFLSRLALSREYNFVYSIHNLYSATIFKKIHLRLFEKWLYRPHHKLIAVSEYILEDYQKVVVRCKSGKVLYNFIDDSFLRPLTGKEIRNIPVKWVAVGSLKEQKNYEFMIACIEALCKAYAGKEITLDIYGDGPLRSVLEKRICKLPFIALKGRKANISEVLDQYDAFISTSRYEGYGISPMEALARGLPLFLSDIPVYREIYGDHAFFFSIDEKNGNGFLRSIEKYKGMDITEKQKGREYDYQYASKVAGSQNYISQLLALYKIESHRYNK